jgi:serine phosphatase RsbU (regulator of sigma subunit)
MPMRSELAQRMTVTPEHNFSQITAQLQPEPEGQYQRLLLRQLNAVVFALTLVGLVFMAIPPLPDPPFFLIVGLSLLVNAAVFSLERSGRIGLAAPIFVSWVNIGLLLLVIGNLTTTDTNLQSAILFSAILALCVMLAGMLISAYAPFIVALANAVALVLVFSLYFQSTISADDSLLDLVTSICVPIGTFLIIIAVISWLYQRALGQASARLEAARQRIMRDELLRRDLAVARELQQRLYPPPPLTNAALRIASRSEPARETSGDFYDFIPLPDDRLGIVVADVTGKSIAAALVMAMSRSTLRSEATRHAGPADVLRYANLTLCQDNTFKQMITAFYGVLDTRTLRLSISNAGHPFPVIRRDGRISELEICGLPLGARPDALYSEQIIQLQPGDQLVIISDGLVEERNARRELFGFERMLATIAQADGVDSERALDEIWQTVVQFRGDAEQSDDITLVVVQVSQDAMVSEAALARAAD